MTPKEKAKNLFELMVVDFQMDKWQSKSCSLIAVDEIIAAVSDYATDVSYWEEVKDEINKI